MIDFLIIGAQRGGSTRLNGLVRQHPEVSSPRGEVGYFEDPYYGSAEAQAALAEVFRAALPGQRKGFKRADLLAREECPPRIARDAPGVRLLATLREPISRAISGYFHCVRVGVLPVVELGEGLRCLLRGEYASADPWAAEIVSASLYGRHLDRYLRYFDRSQLLLLTDEDFRNDPHAAVREVYEHLGVSDSFAPTGMYRRVNSGVTSLNRLRLLRMGTRHVYRQIDGQVVVRHSLAARVANRAVWATDRFLVGPLSSDAKPELPRDVRRELCSLFRPEVARVEEILGRKLGSWRSALASC